LILRADVIIPVKKLSESKTRLSEALSLRHRQELVLTMLEDVVASLDKSSLVDKITVLTADERVIDHAVALGVATMVDTTDKGINESLAKATDYEMIERSGTPLLVLPVDVPLVKPSTIDDIISKVGDRSSSLVVIVPSTAKGTNALLRNPPDVIPTRYGVNSFMAHVKEAMRKRIHLEVCYAEDLQIDLDTPSDLFEVLRKGDSTRTSSYLERILRAEAS
jgi:2-phospho-L-lactate guanylyltransferase